MTAHISQTPTPLQRVVAILAAPMLFVHTFLFGLMARLDPSGHAVPAVFFARIRVAR